MDQTLVLPECIATPREIARDCDTDNAPPKRHFKRINRDAPTGKKPPCVKNGDDRKNDGRDLNKLFLIHTNKLVTNAPDCITLRAFKCAEEVMDTWGKDRPVQNEIKAE